jgi:hypothetical protein
MALVPSRSKSEPVQDRHQTEGDLSHSPALSRPRHGINSAMYYLESFDAEASGHLTKMNAFESLKIVAQFVAAFGNRAFCNSLTPR